MNGAKKTLLQILSRLATLAFAGFCTHAITAETLSADQAKQDVRILKRALTELHPALTKYQTQADIDAAFARFESRGHAARTPADMYLAATELAAAVRCGHTWTNVRNQSGAVKRVLMEEANKLPFTMTLVENRWLVLASADAAVRAGDEIISINGEDAATIVARMMPYLRADGSSDGKRLVQLNHDRADFSMMDIVYPLLSPPADGQYRLQVKNSKSLAVKAVTLNAREAALAKQGVKPIDMTWRFRIENNTGFFTLPTFVFWNSSFDWKKFLQTSFAELNAKQIPNLVIDIRGNEGGDGAISTALLSYLLKQPFRYTSDQATTAYERVPYILAKYLDTWDYDFFDRTGKVEKRGERQYLYKPRVFGEHTIQPATAAYGGRAYMLVGAENSSATFMLAELVKQSGAATLVGQRTGGNLRGLNGGELTWVTLPNSGVSVDIPLLAVTKSPTPPDTSVTPDIAVTRTFAARAAGRDEEMVAALNAIAAQR